VIINIHAPTEDAENEDKEMFYSKLETVYDGTPGSDVEMVMGHFNAKIGKEDIFIPAIGQNSLHQTCNDNSLKAVDFAMSRNLKILAHIFHMKKYISVHGYHQTARHPIR
jgi:hypothetical protein